MSNLTKKAILAHIKLRGKVQEKVEETKALLKNKNGDLKKVVGTILGIAIAIGTTALIWIIIERTAIPKIEDQIAGIGTFG